MRLQRVCLQPCSKVPRTLKEHGHLPRNDTDAPAYVSGDATRFILRKRMLKSVAAVYT